jgi:hypothetical protein
MNSKILFVAIAIVAAFGTGVVSGLVTITPVLAQENMTMGGKMTGGNMKMGDNMDTTSSVIKPNSPDVASSRGVSSISCSSYDYPKISSLLDGMAAVYELEQDNEGNYSAKFWEWK